MTIEDVRAAFRNAVKIGSAADSCSDHDIVSQTIIRRRSISVSDLAKVKNWQEDDVDRFEERAAILEFEAGYEREVAEYLAASMVPSTGD